jgi:hypothetical protein
MSLNWQMITAIVGLVSVVLNCIIFVVIKFNDLQHLHIAVDNIKKHLDKQDLKMNKFEICLTDLKARFQERTKILKKQIK